MENISKYLNTSQNKAPISVFTDTEEEYIQSHKDNVNNGELSIHDKLILANQYRKTMWNRINKV